MLRHLAGTPFCAATIPVTFCLLVTLVAPTVSVAAGEATRRIPVTDVFGRELGDGGVVLVDWEGHLANPAIRFFVTPPEDARFPATATLKGSAQRLYFDLPSTVGAGGPSKHISFADSTPVVVRLSIFPDRDFDDEEHALELIYNDADGTVSRRLPVHVIDQDRDSPAEWRVAFDYSQDESGFFDAPERRATVEQAARDWAYFLTDRQPDSVPAGAQSTWIWKFPAAWTGPPPQGQWTTNAAAYTGYLLYLYGIDTPEIRSGGAPSSCCFQTSGASQLAVRRSGSVEIEIKGNFNDLGWRSDTDDEAWWVSSNLRGEQNDLYSIAHHELGHALAFNSGYPRFAAGETASFTSAAILAYRGEPILVNSAVDHFARVVDPASRRGIFGNEYFGDMPRRRWLITKLDLLLLEAVGYRLRETSSLEPLQVVSAALPAGRSGIPYEARLTARGGIPTYDWTVAAGDLPAGITLERRSGVLSGTTATAGDYPVTLLLRDHGDGGGVSVDATLSILPAPPRPFRRGECNDDASLDLSDAVCLLEWLFLGGDHPVCLAATNTNGDAGVDIADASHLLNHLFLGLAPPAPPFPDCGPPAFDTDTALGCASSPKGCP